MLEISKKFLFYSLIIISLISFINMTILYWFPIQIPLGLYSAVSLLLTAYFLKVYCLIPISFLICVFIFFTALSFRKEQIFLPITSSIYLLCDLFILVYSFVDSWFNDEIFMVVQAIQIVISITVIVFMNIYFILLWKAKKAIVNS